MSRLAAVYSHHKTREQAELALEDYFAAGEIDRSCHPEVVRRKYTSGKVWFNVEIDY